MALRLRLLPALRLRRCSAATCRCYDNGELDYKAADVTLLIFADAFDVVVVLAMRCCY